MVCVRIMRAMTATLDYRTDTSSDELLGFCKAMADQVRLNILNILESESFGVLELCEILQLKQPALTHHLKLLTDAGLLSRRREGNSIFYSRNHQQSGHFVTLQKTLFEVISTVTLSDEIQERLTNLQQRRSLRSEQFFQQNTQQFRANQELVAPLSAYKANLLEMLEGLDKTSDVEQRFALEVGPGDGQFLPQLARLYDQIDALDNSEQMLDLSRKHCQEEGVENITFISGDTSTDALPDDHYDVVVINMVLHHNASAIELFQDVYRVLKSGGSLFVSELVAHQQDWVREACGDIWLGFQPEDLTVMAENSGFNDGINHFLAQRNGFVVQLRQFTKP